MMVRFVGRFAATLLCAMLLASGLAQGPDPQRNNILLVLDASGSMYLQLEDGRYRITAAKEALTEFVTRLPAAPELNVGLRIYGSRIAALDEGACEDSILTVPVPGFDRELLLREIRETQAKGATPIAYSLELAAQDLRAEPGHKRIILVTDGAESCRSDLRDVVERLTGEGYEIDLRIIGFALSEAAAAGFRDLATFENTDSAAELAAALGRAIELPPVTQTHTVHVHLTRRGQPATDGATARFIDGVTGEAYTFTTTGPGTFTAPLPAGSYRAEVTDAFAPQPLTVAGLAVAPEAENTFTFELEPETDVTLTVTPTDPTAGSHVTIHYQGAPSGQRNWLAIAPADATDEVYLDWSYVTGTTGETTLRVPDQAITLEARYHLELPEGGTRVIGRSPTFHTRAATATVRAPNELPAGSAFELTWQGPNNPGDYLTIVPERAEDQSWTTYAYTSSGTPATLTAPIEPGPYEIRYVTGQANAVLARQGVVVTAVSASVQPLVAEAGAGAAFEVAWEGPDNQGDYVTVVPEDAPEGAYTSYAYTRNGSPSQLTAPMDPGRYEVRYVAGQGNRTLASASVHITATTASVRPLADEVGAGAAFEVAWQGPDNRGDYVTVVPEDAPEGAYTSYAYTRNGSPSQLTAPMDPGRYEVRYVTGQGNRTLARSVMRVVAVSASVEPPAQVTAGERFEVAWSGPDNSGDYITVVPEGADEGAYLSYAYTRRGSLATLTAPDEPGRYEVRYVSGQGDRTLASAPVTVR
jgi:Ca-activated chloride channel homolog